MVLDLERRLRVLDELRRHPEIEEVELPPIAHVSGLERSGTTLLHNLLTLPDGHRALRRWELMHPLPPPEATTHDTDPRIAVAQAAIEPLRGTLLERMHWVQAEDPEECQWALLDGSSILAGAAGGSMPTWSDWLGERDPTPAFEEYRRVVQLLLWRNPVPVGGVLVLKAPQFLPHLRQLRSVFPEMWTVLTHRDPYRCLVSTVTMIRSINEPFLDDHSVLDSLPETMTARATRGLAAVSDLDLDGVAHAELRIWWPIRRGSCSPSTTPSGSQPRRTSRCGSRDSWQIRVRGAGRHRRPSCRPMGSSRTRSTPSRRCGGTAASTVSSPRESDSAGDGSRRLRARGPVTTIRYRPSPALDDAQRRSRAE